VYESVAVVMMAFIFATFELNPRQNFARKQNLKIALPAVGRGAGFSFLFILLSFFFSFLFFSFLFYFLFFVSSLFKLRKKFFLFMFLFSNTKNRLRNKMEK
jgi:hypothetical protein